MSESVLEGTSPDSNAGTAFHHDLCITYSHRADSQFVRRLQKQLQNFNRPFLRQKTLNVFIDRTNLTADPDLSEVIFRGLSWSRHLLICASPRAAESKWVNEEIAWWFGNVEDPHALFMLALTDGELLYDQSTRQYSSQSTAMPGALSSSEHSAEFFFS